MHHGFYKALQGSSCIKCLGTVTKNCWPYLKKRIEIKVVFRAGFYTYIEQYKKPYKI